MRTQPVNPDMIVYAILQAATEMQGEGILLRLQLLPGHCDNLANHAAAKDAEIPGEIPLFLLPFKDKRHPLYSNPVGTNIQVINKAAGRHPARK